MKLSVNVFLVVECRGCLIENRCLLRYTSSAGRVVCICNKTRIMQNAYWNGLHGPIALSGLYIFQARAGKVCPQLSNLAKRF